MSKKPEIWKIEVVTKAESESDDTKQKFWKTKCGAVVSVAETQTDAAQSAQPKQKPVSWDGLVQKFANSPT